MPLNRKKILAGAVVAALAAGGAGAAITIASSDDGDREATGPGADRARAAAEKLIPGGTVNAVERDGENGATWEVEVGKPGGGTVDVRLDDGYDLVVIESDSEEDGD